MKPPATATQPIAARLVRVEMNPPIHGNTAPPNTAALTWNPTACTDVAVPNRRGVIVIRSGKSGAIQKPISIKPTTATSYEPSV